jgi:hypothetical protein
MTEAEWLTCADPTPILAFLSSRTSDRKFRLFACACCRRIWHLLSVNYGWVAVRTAESHADGLVGHEELKSVRERGGWDDEMYSPDTAAFCTTWSNIRSPWVRIGVGADDAAVIAAVNAAVNMEDFDAERSWQATLVRDIFGNPFRPMTVNPAWLTPSVIELAQAIYDTKAFDKLPELAAALLEAGCDDEEILSHCRGPGPHVRGCGVVDLVLGKG